MLGVESESRAKPTASTLARPLHNGIGMNAKETETMTPETARAIALNVVAAAYASGYRPALSDLCISLKNDALELDAVREAIQSEGQPGRLISSWLDAHLEVIATTGARQLDAAKRRAQIEAGMCDDPV
jgi:hypothetical protein